MKTIVELKDEIDAYARKGKIACRLGDLETSAKLMKEVEPLVRELAIRTNNKTLMRKADFGAALVAKYEQGEWDDRTTH